jgi:hypothetical protein
MNTVICRFVAAARGEDRQQHLFMRDVTKKRLSCEKRKSLEEMSLGF